MSLKNSVQLNKLLDKTQLSLNDLYKFANVIESWLHKFFFV